MQTPAVSSSPQASCRPFFLNIECSKCHLVCHWGGDIVEEPGGVNYKGGEVRVLLANNQMRFSELVRKIYELLEIDQTCVDLKLKMRVPTAGSYTAVPLHDDNSLNTMWSCVAQLSKFFIELYIEQVAITAKVSATTDTPVLNRVDVNKAFVNAKKEVTNVAPPYVKSLMSNSKVALKLQDELEKIGSKMKQHEDNLKFLRTQKSQLDDAILDLQVFLGKLLSSNTFQDEDADNSHVQSEEEAVQQILKHGNSAAAIFYQLKTHHASQLSNLTWCLDVLGVVATLGKVDDDNLSREDVDVRFPKHSVRSDLPDNYYELENQMKQKKWERERILEDMRREQALLDIEKYNFSVRKQDLIKLLADSSSYITQEGQDIARS
ncbi:hypothetical protein Cgig2_015988 [Carnegiea gigantea]|uniref:Uncharacterized protein n=1 Tax=Carnegiea gigantea TaxID=171969 RepID=A0A9Q1QKZ7_9CARY|nr:hypothetical protein Cgig2_015988 [Carnegiea gigantea]